MENNFYGQKRSIIASLQLKKISRPQVNYQADQFGIKVIVYFIS